MAFLAALSQTVIPLPSAGLFLYILSLLILGRVIQKVQAYYRLRHVPGPPLAGWTGLWLARQFFSPKGIRTFSLEVPALVEKYGGCHAHNYVDMLDSSQTMALIISTKVPSFASRRTKSYALISTKCTGFPACGRATERPNGTPSPS